MSFDKSTYIFCFFVLNCAFLASCENIFTTSHHLRHQTLLTITRRLVKRSLNETQLLKQETSLDDDNLIEENGDWFVQDNNKRDKIVKQGDGTGRRKYSYACGASGKWYKFYALPSPFEIYLRKLPIQTKKHLFAIINHSWYLRNNQGEFTKIVKQGRKHTPDTLYVCGEDTNWYRIFNSTQNSMLKEYICRLPIDNVTKKEEIMPNHDEFLMKIDGAWYFNNGTIKDELVEQSDGRGQKFLYYCRGRSKVWYRFMSPPDQFKIYLAQLPRHIEKCKFFFDGKFWYMLNRGIYRRLVMQGVKHTNKFYLVYADDRMWHHIKSHLLNPQVKKAILKLPLAKNVTKVRYKNPVCDESLRQHNGSWFVQDETGLDQLMCQGDNRGSKSFIYSRGQSGRWYKFLYPPEEFRAYLSQIPNHFDLTRFSFDGTFWYILKNHLFKKLVQQGSIYNNKTLFVSDEDDTWHRIPNNNETKGMIRNMLKLPVATDRYHNFRLRRFQTNNKTWFICNNNGMMNVTALGNLIFYARAMNNNWYKLKNPPYQFINYFSSLPWNLGKCNITLDE